MKCDYLVHYTFHVDFSSMEFHDSFVVSYSKKLTKDNFDEFEKYCRDKFYRKYYEGKGFTILAFSKFED